MMIYGNCIKYVVRLSSSKGFHSSSRVNWKIYNIPELDIAYLCNDSNLTEIESNVRRRKGIGDIRKVNELKSQFQLTSDQGINQMFYEEMLRIPNKTHPDICHYGDEPKVLKLINQRKDFSFSPKEFHDITKRNNLVRTEQLGNVCGNRSYYLLGEMAELEQALVNYFLENMMRQNFELISVPDILPRLVVESCGMNTSGERNQVYKLDPNLHSGDLCLSGTSEIALAGFLTNKTYAEAELPKKLMAVSRCYRAEVSSVAEERGIFRVHEFTKVEMFVVTTPDKSDEALEEIRSIQEKNFESLGLHFQVLDMPPHELGAQAYRKYDIETWMPGRKMYGEISSCSNCTDYQSRRLGIRYTTKDNTTAFVHTLNGTAGAIPRLLIALTENGQDERGNIQIPLVLRKFMRNKTVIGKQKIPILQLIKNKKK